MRTKDLLTIAGLGSIGFLAWQALQAQNAAAAPASTAGLGQWPWGPFPPVPAAGGLHPYWRSWFRVNDFNGQQRRARGRGPTSPYTSTFDPWSGMGPAGGGYGGYYGGGYGYGGTPFDTYNPQSYNPSAVDLESQGSIAYQSALIDAGYSGG